MQQKHPYTHLIWDFNGTVLNDVRLGMDCVNTMLAKRNLPTLPDENAYRHKFGFPIEDYYRRLGFDFEKEDYHTVLAPEWVALYRAGEKTCPLNDGVVETIAALRDRGIPQIMLSASNRDQLMDQLAYLGLADSFQEVLGLDNIHAKSKTGLAVEWRERHPDARPLFVGDTVHDADVADAVGGDCILYVGGHQPEDLLITRGKPTILTIPEILAYL